LLALRVILFSAVTLWTGHAFAAGVCRTRGQHHRRIHNSRIFCRRRARCSSRQALAGHGTLLCELVVVFARKTARENSHSGEK